MPLSYPCLLCNYLCLVNLLDLECDQMDVVTAFLNGDLDEEIFIEVPAVSRDPNRPNLVACLLTPKSTFMDLNKLLVNGTQRSTASSLAS